MSHYQVERPDRRLTDAVNIRDIYNILDKFSDRLQEDNLIRLEKDRELDRLQKERDGELKKELINSFIEKAVEEGYIGSKVVEQMRSSESMSQFFC